MYLLCKIDFLCSFLLKITGASLGIGKCIAIEAAKRGAHVTLIARNAQNLEKASSEVRKAVKEHSQKVHILSSKRFYFFAFCVCFNLSCSGLKCEFSRNETKVRRLRRGDGTNIYACK